MTKIEFVAFQLMDGCKKLGYNIDYYKVQKLAYICQCVHYAMYGEPFSPEIIWYWSNGCEFEEIYTLFDRAPMRAIDHIEEDVIKEMKKSNFIDESLFLSNNEESIINFVLYKYGDKNFKELVELTKKELILKKYEMCDQVCLDNLDDLFITDEEKRTIPIPRNDCRIGKLRGKKKY